MTIDTQTIAILFKWPDKPPEKCPICFEANTVVDRTGLWEFGYNAYSAWRECTSCEARIVPFLLPVESK